MCQNETTRLESRVTTDLPRRPLGTDAEGATHEIDPTTRTVYVLEDDDVVRVEELGERPVTDWIAFVRERRGWDDLQYSDEGIVAAVAEALEGSA